MSEVRVLAVLRHPSPHRDLLHDRVAALPGLDFEVLYLAEGFPQTPWARSEMQHRHRFLKPWLKIDHRGWQTGLHPQAVWSLVRRRPDVVFLGGWADPTVLLMALACRLLFIPYVVAGESFRHADIMGGPARLKRWLASWVVRGAKSWLPTGRWAKEHFVSLGAKPERCRPYPTSPDSRRWIDLIAGIHEREPDLRARLGLPTDGVIVFVGRLIEDKAPEVLLEAFQRLRERHPDWVLVYIGDGPSRPLLEVDGEPAPGVRLPGFLQAPEVAEYLAASDVFVLPSRHETWGAVTTEAAAAGLPVIVSENVGSGPDLLAEGEIGERVPVDDAAALAEAIERWMGREDRRGALADRARARALAWGNDLNLRSLAAALKEACPAVPEATVEAAGA